MAFLMLNMLLRLATKIWPGTAAVQQPFPQDQWGALKRFVAGCSSGDCVCLFLHNPRLVAAVCWQATIECATAGHCLQLCISHMSSALTYINFRQLLAIACVVLRLLHLHGGWHVV